MVSFLPPAIYWPAMKAPHPARWATFRHDGGKESRMRQSSRITSGSCWDRWVPATIDSEAAPSRCELRYSTTPSVSSGPPINGMIEWYGTL